MKKDFAIRALIGIKEMHQTNLQLKKLGVDLSDFDLGIDKLEEAVSIMFSKDEEHFEHILEMVHWWLYDKVDKIIYYDEGERFDLNKVEDFVNYLERSHFEWDSQNTLSE
jgi:hypothetical protein